MEGVACARDRSGLPWRPGHAQFRRKESHDGDYGARSATGLTELRASRGVPLTVRTAVRAARRAGGADHAGGAVAADPRRPGTPAHAADASRDRDGAGLRPGAARLVPG